MRHGLLIPLFMFLIGCAGSGNSCGHKVLLLWPDAGGAYSFQSVEIPSLGSPYRLKGSAAEIFFESGLDERGFQGAVAEPRLTRSGDLCVPQDVESALALEAYAQFDRLYHFEKELGSADQLSWPRKVGVQIHLLGDSADTHNNAHYYGDQDVITLVPYTLSGLPIGANQGIVAHEHFHAHFQSQVINPLRAGLGRAARPEDLRRSDARTAEGLNNFILRGWNEGLADFFATVYTGRDDFFRPSLPATNRVLTGPLGRLLDARQMAAVAAQAYAGADDPRQLLTRLSYGEGTQLGRLMYRLAHAGSETPKAFLARVMRRLAELPAALLPDYRARVMDVDAIVPVLVRDFPVNAAACAALSQALSDERMRKDFSACESVM